MKILLYDVDSVIPNIALMKLSTYHKSIGDTVNIIHGNGKEIFIDYSSYDTGYASVVFTKNNRLVKNFPFIIGGTGFDTKVSLPENIEHLMPDYSLYPDNEWSIGFTTRGCVRKCSFCFVPSKEGIIRYNADISEFYNPDSKKIMLLDNNILAYSKYKTVFEQIRNINKPTCFKQGMDFRLLDSDKVDELLSIRYYKEYTFAYDSISIRPIIERNMGKYRCRFRDWILKFFVLVGYDTTIEQDIFRVMYLKSNKCLPYIMRYETCYVSKYKDFYTDLAAWCNQVSFFKKTSFNEFLYKRHTNQSRIDFSSKIWDDNSKNI